MKQSGASTTPRYHFPPFLAAVGHNTISTPINKGKLSVDPSVVRNTLRSSTKRWASSFLVGPVPDSPHQPSSQTSPDGIYDPRKEETPFADGRLDALALRFLEGLGVRHAVVGVLSTLDANDP